MSSFQRKASSKIKLLSRLESKNGQKWIDLYEDNTYAKTRYYYTMYNGGGNIGEVSLQEAATKVCEVAATMGRLYRADVTKVTDND